MKRHLMHKMRAPVIIIGALILFVAPVRAQDMDNRVLLDRITQLEAQVQDLSRKAYGSSYVPGQVSSTSSSGGPAAPPPNASELETRVSALEQQIRDLTGQVERANFNAQQASANLDKLKSDLDVHFQQLDQKIAAMGNAPSANTPTPDQTTDMNSPDAATADNSGVAAAAPATPEELYNRAYSELQQKQYTAAEKDFRDFLAQNAAHKLAPNAEYWLGETYFARANYKAASAVFAESYQKYPKAIKAPDSLLKLGLSLEQQPDRVKDACIVFRQLTKEYPTASGSIATRTEAELKKLKCQ